MLKFQKYIKEVIQELKKVTWPNQEELKGSTIVVVIFSLIMGGFIALVDFSLAWIIGNLI
ncbi:MAG: preprotein translocase subunit SecE [Fibrobacter sp.]|nr:preprotein translocase subunit SecE [Fibrobacter sp.]